MEAWPDKPVSLTANRGIDSAAFEFVAEMMAKKDLGFFREFGDRLEGKPAQAVTVSGDADNPLQTVSRVELVTLT